MITAAGMEDSRSPQCGGHRHARDTGHIRWIFATIRPGGTPLAPGKRTRVVALTAELLADLEQWARLAGKLAARGSTAP
jgi:hypothetical protein